MVRIFRKVYGISVNIASLGIWVATDLSGNSGLEIFLRWDTRCADHTPSHHWLDGLVHLPAEKWK